MRDQAWARVRRLLVIIGCATAVVLGGAHSSIGGAAATAERAVVASVTDGDTLRLRDGRRVRLVQIDAPELGSGECYSRAARTGLLRLVPVGSAVVARGRRGPRLDRPLRAAAAVRAARDDQRQPRARP